MNTAKSSGTLPKRPKFNIAVDEEIKIKMKTKPAKRKQSTGDLAKSSTITKPRQALADLSTKPNKSIEKRGTLAPKPKTKVLPDKLTSLYKDIRKHPKERNVCKLTTIPEVTTPHNKTDADISFSTLGDNEKLNKNINTIRKKCTKNTSDNIQYEKLKKSVHINTIRGRYAQSDSPLSAQVADISFSALGDNAELTRNIKTIRGNYTKNTSGNTHYEELKKSMPINTIRRRYAQPDTPLSTEDADISVSILGDNTNYERLKQSRNINTARGDYPQPQSIIIDDYYFKKYRLLE